MKSIYSKLNIISAGLFVLGLLFTVFILYTLPDKLEKASGKIDLAVIQEVSAVLNMTYIVVGSTLMLGLGSIILAFYVLNDAKSAEKIIYVEKTESQKQEEADKEKQAIKEDLNMQVRDIKSTAEGIDDIQKKYEKILSRLCMKIDVSQALVYSVKKEKNKRYIELYATFAYNIPESETVRYEFGEGLAGQVAKEGKKINIKDIPEGYITIISGLGASSPNHLAILPILSKDEVVFVVEIASFKEISAADEKLIVEALTLEEASAGASKKSTSEKKPDGQKRVKKN